MDYKGGYHDESDADDEYERSILEQSPTLMADEGSSPTESEGTLSNQHTPTRYSHAAGHLVSPTGLISKWTADQCADYVASLGMEQYADAILDENIDGEALIAMQQDDLKDVGIASMGHRLTILKNVYEIKRKQNIALEPDDYIPPSAGSNPNDSQPTQDDIARIINQIKLRDERLRTAEDELKMMRETLDRVLDEQRRLREDTLPLIRMAKDRSQPLPTPEGIMPNSDPLGSPRSATQDSRPQTSTNGLSRKFSNKKLHIGSRDKMPSPTIQESSSLDPSAAAMAASSHLTDSMRSGSSSQISPHGSQQTSPTSPHYNFQSSIASRSLGARQDSSHGPNEQSWAYSNSSTAVGDVDQRQPLSAPPTSRRPGTGNTQSGSSPHDFQQQQQQQQQHPSSATTSRPPPPQQPPPQVPSQQASASSSSQLQQQQSSSSEASGQMEFMKSFRVSMEEPCHKVLPVALKKYHINDDWRQYSLYIVHGDQERCLGLDERPLILFKQLASEGKKPMFMLRRHAAPEHGFARQSQAEAPPSSGQFSGNNGFSLQQQQQQGQGGGPQQGISGGSGGSGGGGGGGGGLGPSPSQAAFGGNARVQSYASSMHLPGGVL